MAQLSLTEEEAAVLGQALQTYISDLRMEIAGTDAFELREALRRQEAILERILQAVGPQPPR
ncbi:MAG TPA: hypothetical protein VHG28_01445 [Longimicrobiaceae bacterium]|nr:hypothetical protein [Longimicrobiaceae bacterium]